MPTVAHDTALPLLERGVSGSPEPTDHAHEVYSYGDCWALAWHLASLTGGRLWVLGEWGSDPMRADMWHHVVVDVGHLPGLGGTAGCFLDVDGTHTAAALENDWHQPLTPVPVEAARNLATYTRALGARWEYLDPSSGHGETAQFARALLAHVGLRPRPPLTKRA